MATIGVQGRSIPARSYLAGIELAKANPQHTFKQSLWSWTPATGAEIMRQYRADLQARINRRGGLAVSPGRVHPVTWVQACMPQVVLERHHLQQVNRHAKRRLAHRERAE